MYSSFLDGSDVQRELQTHRLSVDAPELLKRLCISSTIYETQRELIAGILSLLASIPTTKKAKLEL